MLTGFQTRVLARMRERSDLGWLADVLEEMIETSATGTVWADIVIQHYVAHQPAAVPDRNSPWHPPFKGDDST